ncbi:MAG TPA: aminotransferase class V-fold PLP-dependent enzyme [Chloroflexota bacterium]|nr:aminotransferase class V-fold PLP-dependent enzyme [Chloroflexota bacterium]
MDDRARVSAIREQLPAVNRYAYLNTGTYGPMPLACERAVREWLADELAEGRIAPGRMPRGAAVKEGARAALARLLGADPTEIALTRNTTEGMNAAVFGRNWSPGDEIVTTNVEHGGGTLPVRLAERRFGAVVRVADFRRAEGDVRPLVEPLLNERTKMVALSHVSWSTGALFDLKPLAQLCRERGILLAVDAAQAAGAIPVDLHDLGVDYYAFPGQKWLMGPSGTGGFYARADRLAETLPAWIGTGAVASHDDLDDFELWADGRRFEGASTANLAAYAGLAAAVNWLLDEVGAEWACGRAARLADRAIAGLRRIPGVEVVTPRHRAPLVCFKVAGHAPADVTKHLAANGVVGRSVNDTGVVRFSTGFYNTEEEIDRAVNLVAELVGAKVAP